ncbi:MAG: cytochrome b/b6 domain-containing protein [Chloroflexi bacterium]|nr:cytochrome b/b6 domain-containing protein [Chloroflexota bacterium]
MRFSRTRILLFSLSALLLAAALLAAGGVVAQRQAAPAPQASPLHPTFALLDADGNPVQAAGAPVSAVQTCGECHDAAFITSHSFHADLGMSQTYAPGEAPSGRPWDTSAGLYGKWNPLAYRYLSPQGDSRVDLDDAAWVQQFAERLAGGGPAQAAGLEMNCFLCHLPSPDNAARIEAIRSGQVEWASTATLLTTGIAVKDGETYRWNPSAFDANGDLAQAYITIQDPSNENCAQCHGLVHTDAEQALSLAGCATENYQTATTGQVISAQKISLSGMNLADKAELARSWDIHAERGLKCTDCHFSLNNPAYYEAEADDRPGHLQYDPRRLEIGEFLEKPDHNIARGQSAQFTIAPELKGTMRRCESCHDYSGHSDWLPYVERHMQELACETCHIPEMYAPAVAYYDWTALQADGQPPSACRGVEGQGGGLQDLVTGFKPALLQRTDIDGNTLLAPYNLVATWFWVYGDIEAARPVRLEDLQAAWLENGNYSADVLAALDGDGDGRLSTLELRLDTPEKEAVIASRLSALGLQNPRIQGEIQPYSINHNVAGGDWATRECQDCHSDESILAASITFSEYLPGGATPEFVKDANTQFPPGLDVTGDALTYTPSTEAVGLYVFGHNRLAWVDWFGALFFVAVLFGVAAHGGLRWWNAVRQPRRHAALKRTYMYAVYERFWHWLQTFVIVLLLFTGLIIHRPDIFGWLSFRHIVTLHNVLAAILVINAALSLFYHLVSGEIQQFIPRPYGFFDQAIVQTNFYLQGIFKSGEHPFEKTPAKKLNPLQQVTYFGILNVLLPLQIITGALMWGVQKAPQIAGFFGGLPFLAPFHSLVAWTFGAFIVGHVYLTTTGHEPLAGIKAMVSGWEESEERPDEVEPPAAEGDQPQSAPAD